MRVGDVELSPIRISIGVNGPQRSVTARRMLAPRCNHLSKSIAHLELSYCHLSLITCTKHT